MPIRTRRPIPYLGYIVRPEGIVLGRKARGRLPSHIRHSFGDSTRLRQSVASFRAAWMFDG